MPTLDDLFAALAGTVREGASAHGYEERPGTGAPGAFGARAARWRRAAAGLALAWDPREQWVSFEFRPSPDRPPAIEWTGTLSDRYTGRDVSDTDIQALQGDLQRILDAVWVRDAR
jgi:hypothetical protein